jgi:NAD(P)-dependent dehydrogenase (short-subunit alcohol dehydrogenase family)
MQGVEVPMPDQSNGFAGRTAVITGGSDGLGRDFCRALCEAGCEVHFCARNAERGAATAASLGPRAHYVAADVADPQSIESFAQTVAGATASVDYLVNNVAVDDRLAVDELDAEACDRMWAVNLRSYLLVTRAFLGLLRAGAGRSIVNVCTTNYMLGLDPFTLYNATKSGIVGFTRSLARELGPEGIRANAVSPGWVMTQKQLREHVQEQDKAGLLQAQALKFLLEPGHVTPAVLFLLGPSAAAITGQNLVVDCGKFMQ